MRAHRTHQLLILTGALVSLVICSPAAVTHYSISGSMTDQLDSNNPRTTVGGMFCIDTATPGSGNVPRFPRAFVFDAPGKVSFMGGRFGGQTFRARSLWVQRTRTSDLFFFPAPSGTQPAFRLQFAVTPRRLSLIDKLVLPTPQDRLLNGLISSPERRPEYVIDEDNPDFTITEKPTDAPKCVPEGGSTFLVFGLGVAGLLFGKRLQRSCS